MNADFFVLLAAQFTTQSSAVELSSRIAPWMSSCMVVQAQCKLGAKLTSMVFQAWFSTNVFGCSSVFYILSQTSALQGMEEPGSKRVRQISCACTPMELYCQKDSRIDHMVCQAFMNKFPIFHCQMSKLHSEDFWRKICQLFHGCSAVSTNPTQGASFHPLVDDPGTKQIAQSRLKNLTIQVY